jgi:F-box/leucine-rich repeat protein 14
VKTLPSFPRCAALAIAIPALSAVAADPRAGGNPFGIKPEGIRSPEMGAALNRLMEAGVVEGRRGSLTFFRWSGDKTPRLTHLGLWGPGATNADLALVTHLPDLEHIALYETRIDDAGLQPIASLSKLRFFSVTPVIRYEKAGHGAPQWSYPFLPLLDDRPRVTGKSLALLSGLTALESVDLLDANIETSDLAALASLPKLSALALPGTIDPGTVARLADCKRLGSLTLGHREITAAELKTLAAWKSLRRLKIIHATLSDEALGALSALETVEEITLEDCGLTDERLSKLGSPPKLRDLILERNEIAGPGLAHLVPLKLRTLGLEFNNLSDATLPHLAQLTTLENLWLAYCRRITDEGIRSGVLQKMTHLRQLRLRGLQQVTDSTLDDLAKFGHLENLTIRETKITWDGVDRLTREMPKTTVFK